MTSLRVARMSFSTHFGLMKQSLMLMAVLLNGARSRPPTLHWSSSTSERASSRGCNDLSHRYLTVEEGCNVRSTLIEMGLVSGYTHPQRRVMDRPNLSRKTVIVIA